MNARDWEEFFYHLIEEAREKHGSAVKEWMVNTLYNWKVLNGFYD